MELRSDPGSPWSRVRSGVCPLSGRERLGPRSGHVYLGPRSGGGRLSPWSGRVRLDYASTRSHLTPWSEWVGDQVRSTFEMIPEVVVRVGVWGDILDGS